MPHRVVFGQAWPISSRSWHSFTLVVRKWWQRYGCELVDAVDVVWAMGVHELLEGEGGGHPRPLPAVLTAAPRCVGLLGAKSNTNKAH